MPDEQIQPEQPQIRPGININLDLGKLLERVTRPELDGRMQSVSSSMVTAAGYNAATSEMSVEFISGRLYVYQGVPLEVFDGLIAAGSKGAFMRSNVIEQFGF